MVVDPLGKVSGERFHGVSAGSLNENLRPSELEFIDYSWNRDQPNSPRHLVGRAGEAVSRVEIRGAGQPPVVASLANGWWALWTPGPMPARWAIAALDVLGRDVDILEGVSEGDP